MATISNAFTSSGINDNLKESLNNAVKSAVGGVSPFNSFGRYFTGSRAIIKVNDKLFGFAFAVDFSIRTEYVENRTIDSAVAAELMPTRITVDGMLSMFHVPGKGPTVELVQSNVLSFLMHRYITIEIRDQMTDQLIFKTNKAVITGRTQKVQAGEMSTMQLSWKALGWIDELSDPKVPQGADGNEGFGSIADSILGAF